MIQRTISRKPYNLKPSKQSRRKSKRMSKRLKGEDKFHYDLDKLKFTIGQIDPLNLRRLKNHKKIRIRDTKRKEEEEERKRNEEEEERKRREEEEERKRREEEEERKRREEEEARKRKEEEEEEEMKRKEEGFQKASPEELAYRDLFVKSKSLENEEICSICLRNFKQRFAWKLSCNHYFHYNCIEKWSNMERYTCPLCRQEYYYP